MNPIVGWVLAALFLGSAWQQYGWHGVVFAMTAIVFWLVLQFNRAMRVMKNAAQRPVGHVPSAVMLHARMKPGLTMMQLVGMTRSLGRQVSDDPERYEWADESGARLTVSLRGGRLAAWELHRDASSEPPAAPPA